MADIVDDFLTRLVQQQANLPEKAKSQLALVENSLKDHWGGKRVLIPVDMVDLERGVRQVHGGTEPYVGKRMSRSTRVSLVAQGLRQARPLGEVFATAGVSRRSGYRILAGK